MLRLAEHPNAEVSVVIGRHAKAFHPKLWLIETATELRVLAGSGNLTASGLTTNDEQFEILRFTRADNVAEEHNDRYARLTRNALPLESVTRSAVWAEWLTLRRHQDRVRSQIAHLERRYLEREPLGDRSADKAVLIEDLQGVYDRTVEADLKRRDGGQYYPTRLLVAINRCRAGERDPVRLVADIVKKETEGLNIIREAGLFELTLEWLVIDEDKPYHGLFSTNTVQTARSRLEGYGAGP